MASPAGVNSTLREVRDEDHPSSSSSLRSWPLRVGWLTSSAPLPCESVSPLQRYQIFEIAKVHRYRILPFNEADSMHKNGAGTREARRRGSASLSLDKPQAMGERLTPSGR